MVTLEEAQRRYPSAWRPVTAARDPETVGKPSLVES